ncbi:AAA family ATPase [Umboniibacter marinipuniceus]|uniref:Adenylate kinase family enzyme n=1 Tax=Umboniibacter marinipuniceus TaxID=569599 RepID=A0A3M0AHX9_9GAMM|nr:AAA family ATPase [Umboniibacter marinipuniceus]RMA82378.1 adenylate kinase family enzyme [Umboniibacter marinipuniceus]
MTKILIFGNSGSGKSTLAARTSQRQGALHLDLDNFAWENTSPPNRRPVSDSLAQINAAISGHNQWIIEGCYSDLLAPLSNQADQIIFLNLPVEDCLSNAKNRPWEPHKYASKADQDANLPMLLNWIADYELRDDTFSKAHHRALYDSFSGQKLELTENQ